MATAAPPAAAAPPLSRAAANRAAFADGVRILLATWPLLQLAVTNEWGGPESTAKAEWLNEVILEVFDTSTAAGRGDEARTRARGTASMRSDAAAWRGTGPHALSGGRAQDGAV